MLKFDNEAQLWVQTFCQEFEEEFLEVQKYISDPSGKFGTFCHKWHLPYEDDV